MTTFAPSGAVRAAAAALALAGIATTASAAVNTTHFQQTIALVCSSGCIAKFPQLAANQVLDIDHVACDVSTPAGEAAFALVKLLPASLNFTYPLELQWQRKFFNGNVYTFGGAVNVRVPAGRQIEVDILIGGVPGGTCSMTGTRYTMT